MNIQLPKVKYRKAAIIGGLIVAAQLVGAEAAFAQSAFTPLQSALQMIVDFVNGPFGRLAGIIAVMGMGIMALGGRLQWTVALAVILGMGLLFGAPTIVDQLVAGVK